MKREKSFSLFEAAIRSGISLSIFAGKVLLNTISTVAKASWWILKKPLIGTGIAGFIGTLVVSGIMGKTSAPAEDIAQGPLVLGDVEIEPSNDFDIERPFELDRSAMGVQDYVPQSLLDGPIDNSAQAKINISGKAEITLSQANPVATSGDGIKFGTNGQVEERLINGGVVISSTPVQEVTPPKTVSNAPKSLNASNSSFQCSDFDTLKIQFPGVPEDSLKGALCASAIYGVPASSIMAIQQNECNFGQGNANDPRNPNKDCTQPGTKNGCSASGPGQFIPETWDNRNQNGKCNRKAGEIIEGKWGELKNPPAEAGVKGYGQDCDGDGLANPHSRLDAACATAKYLSTIYNDVKDWHRVYEIYNGGPHGDKSRTVPYANRVTDTAAHYDQEFLKIVKQLSELDNSGLSISAG